MDRINTAAKIVKNSKHITVFTGAGISVESGIPPFRGENGLWGKYDPYFLHIDYFTKNPKKSWELNKKLFYNLLTDCKPNIAHYILANLEKKGYIKSIITQNIDNLHQKAGSNKVYEFHGTYKKVKCIKCDKVYDFKEEMLSNLPPVCKKCGGILKPDYIFFGEGIPKGAYESSINEAKRSDVFILIGTTGEVQPASFIPELAHRNGAKIIEINVKESNFTNRITDLFLKGKATDILERIYNQIES